MIISIPSKLILCLLVFFAVSNLFAQQDTTQISLFQKDSIQNNQSFKKNSFSVDVLGWFPVISNLDNGILKFKNGELTRGNFFNYGARFSYMNHISKSFGLGLEYAYENSKLQSTYTDYTDYVYFSGDTLVSRIYEAFTLNTHQLYVKLEWTKTNKKGTVNFSHQIGLGIAYSIIPDKNYHFEEQLTIHGEYNNGIYTDPIQITTIDSGIDNRKLLATNKFFGNSFYYSFSIDFKISESLFLNLGIRQAINYTYNNSKSQMGLVNTYEYQYKTSVLNEIVDYGRLVSGQNISLGLKYAF